MKSTGHRVTVESFSEGGDGKVTMTVAVTGLFNLVVFDRSIFGVDPDDLEACDLPDLDEPTGSVMSQDQVDDSIDELRVMIRPDLWEMGPDGIARRKNN